MSHRGDVHDPHADAAYLSRRELHITIDAFTFQRIAAQERVQIRRQQRRLDRPPTGELPHNADVCEDTQAPPRGRLNASPGRYVGIAPVASSPTFCSSHTYSLTSILVMIGRWSIVRISLSTLDF